MSSIAWQKAKARQSARRDVAKKRASGVKVSSKERVNAIQSASKQAVKNNRKPTASSVTRNSDSGPSNRDYREARRSAVRSGDIQSAQYLRRSQTAQRLGQVGKTQTILDKYNNLQYSKTGGMSTNEPSKSALAFRQPTTQLGNRTILNRSLPSMRNITNIPDTRGIGQRMVDAAKGVRQTLVDKYQQQQKVPLGQRIGEGIGNIITGPLGTLAGKVMPDVPVARFTSALGQAVQQRSFTPLKQDFGLKAAAMQGTGTTPINLTDEQKSKQAEISQRVVNKQLSFEDSLKEFENILTPEQRSIAEQNKNAKMGFILGAVNPLEKTGLPKSPLHTEARPAMSEVRAKYLKENDISKLQFNSNPEIVNRFLSNVKKNEPYFINATEDIARNTGGEYVYRMKTPESIAVKMNRRPNTYRMGNLDDVLGSTVITDDIETALGVAKKKYKVTKVDDFRKEPTFLGYKAVHLDVELPNGQVGEIQINTKNGLYQKSEAHKTYDKWRKYIESAQGSTVEDVLRKIPAKQHPEFLADVDYSNKIFNGELPVPKENIQRINEILKKPSSTGIKTTTPKSGIPKDAGEKLEQFYAKTDAGQSQRTMASRQIPGETASMPKTQPKAPSQVPKLEQPTIQKSSYTTTKATSQENVKFNPEKYAKEKVASEEAARLGDKKTIWQNIKAKYKYLKGEVVGSQTIINDTLRQSEKKYKHAILPSKDYDIQYPKVLRSSEQAKRFIDDEGLANVIKEADDLDNLDQYMKSKHALTWEEKGKATGRDVAKDRALVDAWKDKYEPLAQKVKEYNHKLLDYIADTGMKSKEEVAFLKKEYPDYVPFNRIFSEDEMAQMGETFGKRAVAGLPKQTVIQKATGSEREIENVFTSMVDKTRWAFEQGERNKAGQIMADYHNLPDNPFGLEKVKELKPTESGFSFLRNGKKEIWKVNPEIESAMKNMDAHDIGLLGKILAVPVRIAKVGITGIRLPFIVRNIPKDQLTAFINSDKGLRTSVLNLPNFLKSVANIFKKGDAYKQLIKEGGSYTSFDFWRGVEKYGVDKIRSGRGVGSKAKFMVKNPSEFWRALENIIAKSEEFTRVKQGLGRRGVALKEGRTLSDANIIGAKAFREDTVDFMRSGNMTKALSSALMYFNPGIQGSRNLVKSLAKRPFSTTAKIITSVTMPLVTLTAWNMGDEKRRKAYDDIPEWEKENHLIFVPPNPTKGEDGKWNVIKIPFSAEIASLTKPMRRGVEMVYGGDPVKAGEVFNSLWQTATSIDISGAERIASTFTPQAIKPSLEVFTNKKFYTGGNVVPDNLKDLAPEAQYLTNRTKSGQLRTPTSGTIKLFAKKLGVSPIKMEFWLKETFGSVSQEAINMADKIAFKAGVIKEEEIGGTGTLEAVADVFTKAFGGEERNEKFQNIDEAIKQISKSEGDARKGEIQKYIDNLPNDEERTMAIGVMRDKGLDTKGIKISESTITADKLYKEWKGLSDEEFFKKVSEYTKDKGDKEHNIAETIRKYRQNDVAKEFGLEFEGDWNRPDMKVNDKGNILQKRMEPLSVDDRANLLGEMIRRDLLSDNVIGEITKRHLITADKMMGEDVGGGTKARVLFEELKDKTGNFFEGDPDRQAKLDDVSNQAMEMIVSGLRGMDMSPREKETQLETIKTEFKKYLTDDKARKQGLTNEDERWSTMDVNERADVLVNKFWGMDKSQAEEISSKLDEDKLLTDEVKKEFKYRWKKKLDEEGAQVYADEEKKQALYDEAAGLIQRKINGEQISPEEEQKIAMAMETKPANLDVPGEATQPIATTASFQPAGGMRTDRNNNPTAFTTDVARSMGLVEGVDYVQGDKFPGDSNLYTARLTGDPVETTIKGLDKGGFYTASGKPRWSYIAMSNDEWHGLSKEEKTAVIAKMYATEGGNGNLMNSPAQQYALTPEQSQIVQAVGTGKMTLNQAVDTALTQAKTPQDTTIATAEPDLTTIPTESRTSQWLAQQNFPHWQSAFNIYYVMGMLQSMYKQRTQPEEYAGMPNLI